MIKKILLLASLFFTLISFSQKIDASLEHLRENKSVMMERAMPLPLGQRPSGFTQSDINKNSAEKDLTLRGNMTFIGNSNLNRNLKKTREAYEAIYPYLTFGFQNLSGITYTGDDNANVSFTEEVRLTYTNNGVTTPWVVPGNGQFYMDYVDIDGSVDENGDGKDDTFSSSTSTLNLPNCSRVAYAGLYWAGVYPSEFWGNATPRSNDYDKIKFKYPSSTAYKNITADEIIYNVNEPYICFKDITTEVQAEANPNGVYTAANIRAIRGLANGLGGASGWVMIVVYENDNESSKKFSVFDGFATVRDGSPQEVKFTGFKTIPKGPVNVELIMATLEGDSNITGDDYQIRNKVKNYVNVFNTISPQDNFFNGSISVFDTYLAGRNPASTNTLGFDVDHIKINNTGNSIIGNNETEAEVKFTSVGDVYWPFLNAMSVEVVEPEIKLVKTAVDATNTPITSEVALGGDVYYNITFQNIGTDNAKNTVIVDELKTTVDFEDVLGNVEVSDSRITYIYEASTVLNGGGGKLTFNIPDDLVKVNGAEHWIKIKVNATTDCSKLRDACANKVKNQAVATYERDESKLSASNPGYVQGYNTLTTLSYAGLEPSCNLGIKGTTNFTIDTSKCKGSTQVLCGGDTELSAGAGFDSYEWVNTANPAIVLATTQNYKATQVGTYQVTSIAPNGCTDKTEIINIVGSNLATNPLKPFVNQVLPICNGFELSEIYLCGTADFREIILPFGASLATEVKWSKLDETKPCDATKPTELPSTNNCANIGTKCSWDEIGTKTGRELSKKFDKKGQYKLEVLYDGQCPATYYFNVFSGALNPKFDKKNIVCGVNGSIIVNGVPSGYEYKLTAPSGNTIPVNGFQNNNEFKNLSEVGNYDITIKLKGSTLASCSFDYIVKIDEQALGLTVDPEFNAGCDGKAIITAQVNGTLPGNYIYTLLNSVGGVIETKAATLDRSVTFEVTNAGLYSVKVATTTTTCTETVTTRVIKPTPLTLTAVATKNITCTAGSSDGIITLAGANGVPNTTGDKYSYALLSINGAAVSPKTYFTDTTYNVVNGTEGDYIFEVTDSKNCTATATAKISVEAPLQFTHKETQVNCNKKGTITVDVTKNTGYKLEYSIDNANWQLLNTFDTLDATTAATLYTVYIRATKGTYQCNYQIQNIAITETGGLSAGSAVATGLECRWGNTQSSPIGTIAFTAPTGGTAPFTYFYKLASDTNFTTVTSGITASVPVAGTYNTKVEDKNGCSLALDTVTIDALPTEPTIKHEILICGNTATVIITPKDASYSYSIDGTNFQASNVFENVRQDWYKFSIKYGKSCTVKTPYVSLYGRPLTGSVTATTDSDCSGSDNGSITVNARNFQGGSYEYSTDGGTTWEETGDNPYRIVGLAKGDYDLKIRETIGTAPNQLTCEIDLGKHTIGEPTKLELINTGITTPATCVTGATITVQATGGTPPYKFSIDKGVTWQNANASNQYIYTDVAVSTTKYQVMLLDSKKCDECGCTDNPFENGSFEDRYFTGYYPYIADESNFTGWETTAADNEMELWYKNNFEGVPSYDGSDHFVELNANTVGSLYQEFCTKPGDEINWSVAHRGRLGRDVATVKIGKSLATATIEETMSDGKTWKEYSGTYTVPVGQTTTVISFDAVSTFTKDKSIGNFIDAVKIEIVRATCVLKDIEVTAAVAATHTATVTDSCTDPKIEITATGTAPYQFTIDNGATWQTSNNAMFVFNTTNGLALPTTTAVNYQVKTINGGGCESPVSTLTVYPKLTATVIPTPETCKKGFFTITDVKGGNITTTNYVYAIVLKDATPTTTDFKPITNPSTKSGGLSAENYDIYIRDNGGNAGFCELKIQRAITKTENPIVKITNATALDCTVNTKASISFEVSEGKAPFSYTVNGGTSTTILSNGNAATIPNLDAGTYKIIVTDANNCVSAEISEKIEALAALTDGSAVATNLKCSTSGTIFGTITFTNPTTGTPDLAGNYTFYYKLNGTPVTAFQPIVGSSKTGLPAGIYNTKVVDSKGCEKDLETVTINPLPTVLTTIKPVTYNCDGTGNVKVTVTTTPIPTATAPITYTLGADTNETGEFTKLSVGNHTVSVNYGSDCILPVIVEVKDNQNFTAVASSVENPKCKDGTDGEIKVVASFGSVAVNYFEYSTDGINWTPVASDEVTIDTFGEGNHTIKVKNLGGCEVDSNAITLTAPTSEVVVDLSTKTLTKEITCTLPTGATITPSASGGNGSPYIFELFDSLNNPVAFTGLSAGTYSVVATDKLGCKSDPFEVIIADKKGVDFTATPSVCHTGSDAEIELTAITGNDANFTFSVHDGTSIIKTGSITGIAHTISGLSAGAYKVTVTDGFGCSLEKDVTINLQLKVSGTTTQPTCKDGILDITASGGSGVNYVYAVVSENTAVKDADFGVKPTTITEGIWDIYVRDNGGAGTLDTDYCQAIFTTNKVTKIPELKVDTVTAIQPKCSTDKGIINVKVSGGKAAYTVTLTGSGANPTVKTATGNVLNYQFTGLDTDTYTITVEDINTCTGTAASTEKITVPSALTAGLAVPTDLACGVSGGSITFSGVSGGTPDYIYSYKLTGDATYTPLAIGATVISNLSAGTYDTKVSDAEGCTISLTQVTIKPLPTVPIFDPTTITYNCDGTATIEVTPTVAAAMAYSYMLDKDKTTTNNTGEFTAVAPGSHTVSVSYGSNCSTDIIVEVKANQEFTASITGQTNPVCKDEANGKIEVTASFPSVTPTSFEYSTDGTTWITVNSNKVTIDGFNAGTPDITHTINVRPTGKTSPSACDVTLTKILTNPTEVKVTKAPHTKITCTSTTSTITPTASGGNGGTYTYTVESLDNLGNSLSPKVISSTLTGLSAGKYNVVAKDKLGCPSEAFEVVIAAKEDVEFTATASACHTGSDASIKVDNIKGNGTYSFALTGTATKTGNITGTTHTIPNLSAGTYTVTVTDGFGCELEVKDIIINAKITATLNTTQETCKDGTLTIASVAGGNVTIASATNYVYAVVAEGSPVPTTFIAITNPLTTVSLSKGKYDVYIRDNNGNAGYCQYKETKEITKIPDLTATAKTPIQPKCNGETGSLVFEISGGKATYTYTINGAIPAAATVTVVGNTHTIAGLLANDYTIIVTDDNNCSKTITQKIEDPIVLTGGSATPIHFTCKTLKGGIDFVNPNGGTGVYTFSYKLDGTPVTAFMPVVGNQQLGLDAGTYNIKVKDVNNCEITLTPITINPLPAAPTLTKSVAYNCDGKGTVTVTATPSAVLPIIYTYSLDGATPQIGANPNVFADLDAGSYTVSVGYGSDCFTDIDVIVANDKKFGASVTKTVNPTCFGESDGSITIEAVNATLPYEYSIDGGTWKSAATNIVTESGLADGTYDVKVRQNNTASLCEVIVSTEKLDNPDKVGVTATVEQEITCSATGTEVGATIKVEGTKGTSPYTYELFDNTNTSLGNTLTGITAGTYTVVATDKNGAGCKSDPVTIEVKAKIDVSFDVKALCYDGSNGTINVTNILGNGKFKYTQNGGTTLNAIPAGATSFTITGLSPGVHKIKIIDERGCSLEKTITIYPELSATATPTNLSCTPAGNPTGQILVVPSGGTGFVTPTDYQFSVVTANTTAPLAGTYSATNPITGLAAGTYDVYVKDAQNCEYIVEDVIIKTITPVKITTTANQPQCNGNKGSIDGEITANTGQAPFTITLKDSAGITAGTTLETLTITGTTFSFNNLVDETYTIEITDALGCKFTKTETIASPIALVIDIKDVLPLDCVDTDPAKIGFDFKNVNAANYTPNKLQYTIDNGATWIDYTDGKVRGLNSGELVYIGLQTINTSTNAVVCSIFKGVSYEISYNLSGLIVNPVANPLNCSTGFSVTVEADGGNSPFEFAIGTPTNWLLADTTSPASVPPTIPAIPQIRTRTFDGLIQGLTYEFFVKDALNCIKKNSDSVYVDFTPTVLITPTINKKSCFTTIPNTGTGQITFDIDNKSTHLDATFDWFIYKRLTPATKALITDPIIAQSPAGGETSLTITSPADLEAGTYYILLSNRIGTPVCQFGSLDIEIEQGTEIKGNLKNIKDITCALPGQIRIEGVNGGFGDYIYTATATEGATTTINGDIVSVSYPTTTPIPATVDVTVTVTDKNGCGITLTETLKVSQNPTINPVTVNSCGAVNTIAINTTDGLAPYQYSIDGGVTFTAPISTANHTMNVSDGLNQILTVKDANGCTATANFNVHPDITFDITNITVPSCDTSNNSANNATATITVNTGSGDYQYSLDGVLPAVDITGTTVTFPTTLTPGNHTIKIIDKQNATCTLQKTFTVSEPIKPSFTHTFTDSKCATDNSGTITLTSTEALTYTINPDPNSAGSITTNIFSALPPNTYTVTGKGTNSCTTEIKDIIITEFKAIIVPTPTVVNGGITQFACTAGNTRNSAIVKVNKLPKFGGSGTYTKAEFVFTPNGGGAVETPPASSSFEFTTDNVLGGTVDITVYDDKGCSGTTRAIIAAFTPIADLLATQKTPITCSANESIEVTFTGTATEIKVEQIPTIGTGYTQTPATASASGTIFTGLPVGKYTITIKNDKGCELTTSYTVKEIPAYTILLSDKIDTSCFGTATGSIKFDVDNYTGDYTYEIVTKAGASLSPAKTGTAVNGIQSISKLPKGEYKVKISTGTINCTVTDKDFKIEDALNGKLEVTASATEVSCIGGTSIITANATKGWGSYEYQLEVTGTPNVPYRSGDDFATNGNNNVFKNLPSGSYTVRVKDGNGCSDATFDVPEITNPTQVEFTVTKDDTVCDANIAGSITVDLKDAASGLAGGKPPYTYTLTNTTSGVVKTKTITDTEYTFTGLSKANYTVSVKDANQCIGTGTAGIEIFDDIVFNEPTLVTGLKCQTNGVDNTEASYEINVSGGSGTFTYLVTEKDDTNKVITVTPATLTPANPPTFKTSVAGDYTITITDTGATPNCTITRDFTVQESVKPEFTVDATKTDICNGSSDGVITITSELQNGINDLTYTINATPTITFDPITKTFSGLKAGKYIVTGTGTNDCTFIHAEIEIKQTDEVKIGANAIKDIEYSCSPEIPMATIKVDKNELSGGSGNYNVAFVYDNGTPLDNTDDVTQAVPNVFKFTTTNTSGGKVKIIVSDDQGCSSTEEEVTIPAFAPILDLLATPLTKITCTTDESIKVSFTGNATEIKVEQIPTIGTGYSQTKTPVSPATSGTEFKDLPTGNYTISVTDAVTGCDATTFHTVSKIPVYDVVLSDKKDIACFNGKGSIKIDVKDYTGNYNYEVVDSVTGIGLTSAITGNGITAGTPKEITGLEAGKYKVKITLINSNDKNCSVNLSSEFEIIKPAIILGVTADVTTKISCTDDANATITATATGGWNSSYEYQLEDTSGTAITVKDALGADVIYDFANNGSNNIFENLPAGTYKVRVKDALGCDVESAEVEVENPTPVTFSLIENSTSCNNKIGGEITVTGSGGTGTYTYTLTDDSNPIKVTTQTGVTGDYTFTNLPAAVYTVSVTDTNLCVGTEAPTNINPITINPDIEFTLVETKNVDCSASPNGEVTVTLVDWSTTSNYTYSVLSPLNPGSISGGNVTSKIFTIAIPSINTTPQTYTVIISENGSTCGIEKEITIAPKLEPIFKATPSDKICNGTETGVITITDEVFNGIKNVTYTISLNGGTLNTTQKTFDAAKRTFSGLPEGTYTITGTGDNKCPTSKKDVKIEKLDKVTIGANAIQNVTYNCDVANPKATITVDENEISGGNGDVNKNYNVEFVYDSGTPTDNTDDVTQIASSTFTFTTYNVLGGIVEIKVTDDQGCDSDIKTVTIPAFAPILPSDIQISHTPICEDKQSITVKLDNLDPTIITNIKVEIKKPDGTITSKETPRALANTTGTVFNNLPVGIYTISIEDPVTGCVTTAQSYSVEEPVYNVLYSSIENTTCTGSATGSVVIDVQKGNSQEFYTGEYEYEVLDSVGNSLTPSPIKANVQAATGTKNPLKISGLKAGSYYVKITEIDNATACSFTSEVFTIEDAPDGKLEVTADISSEIICTNDNNATITATATGGWGGNYEYQLEYAVTKTGTYSTVTNYDFVTNKYNNRFTNLKEGFYIVKAKDSHGCSDAISDVKEIINPKPVTFKTEMIANICSDTKPAIKVTAQGGSGEYIYTLKDSAGIEESITTTSLTHTFENLSVDNNENYTVSVNDVKGCIGTPETVNADVVTVYPDIALGLTPGKLTCIPGSENAEYIINVTGGSGDFDYSVVDKNDATNIVAVIKTTNPPTFSIANAGTYILKIIDNKAETTCNSIESEDIVVDDKLVPAFEPQILVNNICNGSSTGEVLVKETPNGINPLEYSINTNPIITLPIGEFKFTGLSAGTYTITGKGTNDCTATKDVTIVEKTKITLDIVEIQNSVVEFSCTTGNQTNMATVTVIDAINGGTVPGGVQNINRIVFVYDNGTPLDATDDIEQDENDLIFNIVNNNNDIKAGTVTITVYDAQNCSSATTTVAIDAFQKIAEAEIKTTQKLDCTNKEIITVKANHDIANPNIANLIYTIKGTNTTYDEQETIVSATGIATFTGLDTDAYTITITNPATGCVFTTSHTVKDEPTFNIKIGGNKRTCFDATGIATATVTLDIETIIAAADYTGAYTYEVVDVNGTTGNVYSTGNGTGGVQNMISGLTAGTYKVKITMTDTPGCEPLSKDFTIESQPELTLDDSIVTFISCNSGEGAIILKADGGWGNYEYQLEEATAGIVKPFSKNNKFEELSEGSYTATVRDVNNCEATLDFVLVKGVQLTVKNEVKNNVCEGEKNASIEVNVTGGGQTQDTSIRTYSYILKYPTELGGLELEQTSNVFTGLQAGNYQVRVIDNKYGCTTGALENVKVEIKDPNKVIISSVNITEDITCNIPTASVEVTAGGGKAPYEFSTDGINYTASASTTYTFTGLNPGLNTFYVKDTEQCVTTTTATIAEYVDLEATLNVVSGFITCKNDSNGVLSATVTGGFGNYEYQLLAGNGVAITGVWQISNTFSGLTPATYKIKVRSTNRFGKVCEMETIKDHEIKEPEVLEPFIKSVEHVTCNGGNTGVITASAIGGNLDENGKGKYEYNIYTIPSSSEYPENKFVQSGVFTNLPAGEYYIMVKDVIRGCISPDPDKAPIKVTVKEPNVLEINPGTITQQVCIYDATPTITVNVTGGTQPYYISINNDELLVPYSLNQITLGKDEGIEAGKKYSISVRGKDEGCSVATLAIQETTAAISLDVEAFSNYTCDSGNFIKAFVADKYKDDVIFTLDNGINAPLTNTTGEFIDVAPGDAYKVTATHTASSCTETSTDEFDIQDIQALAMTIDDSEKNKLIANVNFGLPPYNFTLDGVDYGQDNEFTILQTKEYEIKVTDARGCEVILLVTGRYVSISVLNLFTPDGDGINDFWYPLEVENYHNIKVYIYDRYARKIQNYQGLTQGWDGTYQGKPLPAGDYWYTIYYNELSGEEKKLMGHFTLYR
ncbi:T9SS type B sorting domain-containing protein [Tenacibaculum finnmarkense]|uniref:T9SS type B sorting domain-containing protein n=1 Tax=Tenacibaculum finnmarkense TaxID=2781243 RepID=UPI00187B4A1D|nr:T9SS type B sorting domain-containing protein [Tenacibaculum finnmarkense]MBE7652622.1 T9SS type B sorting domain-containing protein [Tenacibaculum finnmarkense genomovar finnmarkense]MCG8730918.1 T9SS type B sorting domain-containing protein [Tenacibaculum finnmarkense]MCG8772510.1 T9SS type B sorting domain-containing protein [Tenacibaculum finnmarkense]MCG8835306.1 T9SS type B sorting domain-containing protein [Tenacibaculum finnmarkense]